MRVGGESLDLWTSWCLLVVDSPSGSVLRLHPSVFSVNKSVPARQAKKALVAILHNLTQQFVCASDFFFPFFLFVSPPFPFIKSDVSHSSCLIPHFTLISSTSRACVWDSVQEVVAGFKSAMMLKPPLHFAAALPWSLVLQVAAHVTSLFEALIHQKKRALKNSRHVFQVREEARASNICGDFVLVPSVPCVTLSRWSERSSVQLIDPPSFFIVMARLCESLLYFYSLVR